jgi:hypothetical protein
VRLLGQAFRLVTETPMTRFIKEGVSASMRSLATCIAGAECPGTGNRQQLCAFAQIL